MRKINKSAVLNLIGMVASAGYILYNFYILAIYPFVKNQLTSLTLVGTLLLISAIMIFFCCTDNVITRYKEVILGKEEQKY